MNEHIQTIASPGYSVQPATSAAQTGDENNERNRSSKLSLLEPEAQQAEKSKSDAVLTEEELEELMSEAKEKYQSKGITLHFSVHEETGQVQVEVVNSADDTVIRKIPRDEMLKLSAQIKEMAGTLLDRSI